MQQHDVAGHKFLGGDAELPAGAAHGAFRGDHAGKGFNGLLRLGFLEIADDGVNQHNGEDDAGVHPFAEERGDTTGGNENVNERLVELLEKLQPLRRAAPGREAIGAEPGAAGLDFGLGEAGLRFHRERGGGFGFREVVGVFRSVVEVGIGVHGEESVDSEQALVTLLIGINSQALWLHECQRWRASLPNAATGSGGLPRSQPARSGNCARPE